MMKAAQLQQIDEGIIQPLESLNNNLSNLDNEFDKMIDEKLEHGAMDNQIENSDMDFDLEQSNADMQRIFGNGTTYTEVPIIQIALQKLNESRAEIESIVEKSETLRPKTHLQRVKELDPEILKLYNELAEIMKVYRSGQIPRAFKVKFLFVLFKLC